MIQFQTFCRLIVNSVEFIQSNDNWNLGMNLKTIPKVTLIFICLNFIMMIKRVHDEIPLILITSFASLAHTLNFLHNLTNLITMYSGRKKTADD